MNEENSLDLDSLDFSKCSIDEKFWALLLLVFATCKDVDFVKNIKERFGVDLDNTHTEMGG